MDVDAEDPDDLVWPPTDWKSVLREALEAKGKSAPEYRVEKETPPRWIVGVYVDGHRLGEGVAHKKRAAERMAAKWAVRALRGEKIKRRPSPKTKVLSLIGQLGQERGARTEKRVIDACRIERAHLPEWITAVERATQAQDQQGIDVVIRTRDVGDLYLQIKGSNAGRARFEEKRRFRIIRVVVIRTEDDDLPICVKVVRAAMALRAEVLRKRR